MFFIRHLVDAEPSANLRLTWWRARTSTTAKRYNAPSTLGVLSVLSTVEHMGLL